ncbi:MAG: UDP-N-acetylglucosamine 1-carboxyvinyltransferase [Actinomycetia bacterium]|nr:UDP-N-acetylglucosamine 1-carboxyvinyltransferase [Actinomycetes bacterium]
MQQPQKAWRVEPNGPLVGNVAVRGSKNGVTKHMVAAMLGNSPSRIENAPEIGDIDITAQMLEAVGCEVHLDAEASAIDIEPRSMGRGHVPVHFSGLNRIPILMVGPLLHHIGEAFVPMVGGDDIGARPIDFHVGVLEAMGADIQILPEGLEAKAARLHGAHIELPYPSVGATENALLCAVLAKGQTIIDNAAVEPEVIELALFLQRMGAVIEMRPDRRFIIEGVDELEGAEHKLQGDRLETFSYLVAGLITGGEVTVHGCRQDRLVTAISTLHRMGARFTITDTSISARADHLTSAAVETNTHPGFMTDWQSPLVALFTQCHGLSVMHETVYENRFPYVPALNEMGAEIELFTQPLGGTYNRFTGSTHPCSAVVKGPTRLQGRHLEVPDIRGGFAHVLAAAAADGQSIITGVHHLERGYHRPVEAFAAIGLSIERVDYEG